MIGLLIFYLLVGGGIGFLALSFAWHEYILDYTPTMSVLLCIRLLILTTFLWPILLLVVWAGFKNQYPYGRTW